MARDGKSTQLRLLVPTPLCGAIIGKGGATIRSFAEDSRAAITVSPQDKQPLGIPDRVVRITGAQDQLLRAVALLLTKLVESPNYTRFTTSNVSYGPPPQVSLLTAVLSLLLLASWQPHACACRIANITM